MSVYYNEFDRHAAAWLRELIRQGHLPLGEVDERSIADVRGSDLAGFDQCHFFAGIGGWPYALDLAGWRGPVWTGSCPCQPFSAAGKRGGTTDARHLWPEFYRLIAECNPPTVFGEQVASKDGRLWLAGVRADLEVLGYAVGAADLCAAGVGAPHIRQRLWWVGHSYGGGSPPGQLTASTMGYGGAAFPNGSSSGVADAERTGQTQQPVHRAVQSAPEPQPEHAERSNTDAFRPGSRCATGGLGDAAPSGRREECPHGQGRVERSGPQGGAERPWDNGDVDRLGNPGTSRLPAPEQQELCGARWRDEGRATAEPGSSRAFWSDAELIPCLDGKARRFEPGAFPLAHGVSGRVGRLRGYGNAIVPQVAAEFVGAFMDGLLTAEDLI